MESRRRSLLKALSWRIVALTVTACLGYAFTGSVAFAAGIGVADSLIKIFAYYMHERAWTRINVDGDGAPGVDTLEADPTNGGRRLATVRSVSPR
jgi:adenylylsulfate kinase